jgi:hypothetical protein
MDWADEKANMVLSGIVDELLAQAQGYTPESVAETYERAIANALRAAVQEHKPRACGHVAPAALSYCPTCREISGLRERIRTLEEAMRRIGHSRGCSWWGPSYTPGLPVCNCGLQQALAPQPAEEVPPLRIPVVRTVKATLNHEGKLKPKPEVRQERHFDETKG